MIYPATEQYIDLACNALQDGKVIVYPTDTLYGFGVDATNTDAIQQLNRLKDRVQPLSIILESIEKIEQYAKFTTPIKNEINKILPGQYTVLLPAKEHILSLLVQNGSSKIGIRVPDHFFPINLVRLLQKPIITTSINRHNQEALNDVTQIEIDFPNIDIFEDSNHILSQGSTIVDFSISKPKVLRKGDSPYPL